MQKTWPCPRVVLAAMRGGSGKTLITLGMAAALAGQRYKVIPFKKGPDYIDAAWLSLAAGHPCHNLDTYLMGREQTARSFSRYASPGVIALIEGNRGLYDGMDAAGSHSTAELAKLLRAPVLIIVDCEKTTRTAAAWVLGCQKLDPEVNLRGVILNRIARPRHEDVIRRSIADICRIPVVGALPRLDAFPFPERHLGLIPPQEHTDQTEPLARAGAAIGRHLDLPAILRIAQDAVPWDHEETSPVDRVRPEDPLRIGIVRDHAFQFYYPENIESLGHVADVVEVSALSDSCLPRLDALYIGGGFPETHVAALAGNAPFRNAVRDAAEGGLPIYAECGGLMYLSQSLVVEGASYPMAGVLPITAGMERRPQGHGYTLVRVEGENPFYPVGTVLRGHEFHYSRVLSLAGNISLVLEMQRGEGIRDRRDGLCRRNVLALYTHCHASGTPEWAEGMVRAARTYRDTRRRNGNPPQERIISNDL